MNYIQKQAALQKLAQVRLAINYVMRNRGMKKQAGEPQFGDEGYVAPEWQWMKRFDETAHNSPNNARVWKNGYPFLENTSAGTFSGIPERLSMPVSNPKYLSPDDPEVRRAIENMGGAYNKDGSDWYGRKPFIDVYNGRQSNFLPPWGIESIMNADTPEEKIRQGQNWIFKHREPGYNPLKK